MADKSPTIQDSAVAGDVHIGDVHNVEHQTSVDRSTTVQLPAIDGAASAGVLRILSTVFRFVRGIINSAFVFATITVLVFGFLLYSGSL